MAGIKLNSLEIQTGIPTIGLYSSFKKKKNIHTSADDKNDIEYAIK